MHQPSKTLNAPAVYFDAQDHRLLSLIDSIQGDVGRQSSPFFDVSLHPHGIVELVAPHSIRMAVAVINLLNSIEADQADRRLTALDNLYQEVLRSAQTDYRYNTARVLISLMKDIVRIRDDKVLRLRLVRDFRRACVGHRRVVRHLLRRYHLLEMPENQSQLALDNHVHDSNTKGRKNPTHLIMDAWVKGLRFITVIYYNFISVDAVSELLRAAQIMGIVVHIGLEYHVPFRGRKIALIWEPSNLRDIDDAAEFLNEPGIRELMEEGRHLSARNTRRVLELLEFWNETILGRFNAQLGIDAPPIDRNSFLEFVGAGQASDLHLAELIHTRVLPLLDARFRELEAQVQELEAAPEPSTEEIKALRDRMAYLNALTLEELQDNWLGRGELLIPPRDPRTYWSMPLLASVTPEALTLRLQTLRVRSRIRLNLADLSPEDVLEILWLCRGRITHLESFNLREYSRGQTPHLAVISELQQAINNPSPLPLKYLVSGMLRRTGRQDVDPDRQDVLRDILQHLRELQRPYLRRHLGSHVGTDSTSNASIRNGMGLVQLQTLTRWAKRRIKRNRRILRLPLSIAVHPSTVYTAPRESWWAGFCRETLGWTRLGYFTKREWKYSELAVFSEPGDVITLGSVVKPENRFRDRERKTREDRLFPLYLNTGVLNALKVLVGLLAAMLTFLYTQNWWFLAWFGAIIWFGITALRNVAQSVLSGGVLKRSLLRWNSYVNVSRVCDSLLYTGFSVPLLELGVRYLLLERTLDVTVNTHPFVLFTVMSLVNGFYLASHNIFRGLPQAAVVGNIFRSFLAIPVAILYNFILRWILAAAGVPDPGALLQVGAAIISKTASDTVAGMIEGYADRNNNIRLRRLDYADKWQRLLEMYTHLELAYPERNILGLLAQPERLLELARETDPRLEVGIVANALDMMYFHYYQPQAQQTLLRMIAGMTPEECVLLARSQFVLSREKEISVMLLNGLVGENFAQTLSFYLSRHREYLEIVLQRLCMTDGSRTDMETGVL
ncbi:MAG: hypothetical protein LBR22_03605 [Desulfovibrio sp.]|jgi:hypothetical protein|nr:hypothetical protein [Desulfovibrio sp.]